MAIGPCEKTQSAIQEPMEYSLSGAQSTSLVPDLGEALAVVEKKHICSPVLHGSIVQLVLILLPDFRLAHDLGRLRVGLVSGLGSRLPIG